MGPHPEPAELLVRSVVGADEARKARVHEENVLPVIVEIIIDDQGTHLPKPTDQLGLVDQISRLLQVSFPDFALFQPFKVVVPFF